LHQVTPGSNKYQSEKYQLDVVCGDSVVYLRRQEFEATR